MAGQRKGRIDFRWVLAATCAAAVVAIGLSVVLSKHPPGLAPLLIFIALAIVADNAALSLPSTMDVSPHVMFVLAAMTAFNHHGATLGTMLVAGVGGIDISQLRSRRFSILTFNCAQYVLAGAAASLCYEALWQTTGNPFPMMVCALAAYAAVNYGLVLPSIVLVHGVGWRQLWADGRSALPNCLVFGFLGLALGRLYVSVSPYVVLGVLVIGVLAHSVFSSSANVRQAYNRLEALYGFTRALERSQDHDATVESILSQLRRLLKAELAELTILNPRGAERTSMGADEVPPFTTSVATAEAEPCIVGEHPVLISQLDATHPLRTLLAGRGITDAMVAPLRIEADVIGTLLVANQHPAIGPFGPQELQLFEALANHAAVSLANTRLVDRLRWDSRHDQLTGLANRRRFNELINELIVALPSPSAVLIVDLDRFKEVNDTLGHHHGDLLLAEVANRLELALESRGTVARLGGDEFGVLVREASTSDAAQTAVSLLSTLEQPFRVGELELEITASIGVAVLPAHGEEAGKLLQRADIAMYAAKEAHSGWELYSPERDHHTPRRLALAGQLRRAIDNGELCVHYQPKADLTTGHVSGVEALVRWEHDRYGLLAPDDFVPIAERAGLIRALTLFVLETAAGQQVSLRRSGINLDFAVNLSVRSVLDVNLPDEVAKVLSQQHVDPTSLTFEITEGSVMADPAKTIGVLGRLSALGVSIAIDDFGTGYSSLSYLKRLPVDEIKIDRSFVGSMLHDSNDATIVRSTIDLAHSLSLRVVAEGVEDCETWDRLADARCDKAQGYYISPPLRAEELTHWVSTSHLVVDPQP